MKNKYQGLSTAYKIFKVLQYLNPILIIIVAIFVASPFWDVNDAFFIWFGIILAGTFLAFFSWLFVVIYKDIILLFVQMGKDVNEIKQKK